METYNETQKLIFAYVKQAKYCVDYLKSINKTNENILRAKIIKAIANEGSISKLYYKFHGVGCYFEYDGGAIDIDFGPDDRCDGFDLFRLINFFNDMQDKKEFSGLNKNIIEHQFEELITKSIIYNPHLDPTTHLYYLRENMVNVAI